MRFLAFMVALLVLCVPLFGGKILLLEVEGSINPVVQEYVLRGLRLAVEEGAPLVVILLDTPGGLDSATKEIVEGIIASEVPVVVYVYPAGARAASAGTFILLSADIAAMAPGTSVGAAHPVLLTGDSPEEGEPMAEKALNDAVSRIRAIAELRGRNADWAEKAVRESATATATEALELGVIDLVVTDLDELLASLNGWKLPDGRVIETAGIPVVRVKKTLRERLLSYLADPNLVYILLLIGLYGLIYEFFSPGIGIGFVVGGISLILALMGLQVLPINLAGLGLILFGVLLMVLDVFTPTNGILTTGGVISLLLGSFSLFEVENPAIGLSRWTVIGVVGTVTAFFVFVVSKGLLAQRRRPKPLTTMVGLTGVAKTDLVPGGKEGWVLVRGEYWRARAEEPVSQGDKVEVIRQDGKTLVVRRGN
ncbi:nodulation protein NfeD [Candidatus Acetothermia bacterium]|nr:MAG: nodulation protein NfeD [Candidatus Acetothermia bacterium]RLE34341.1 MAG: nodulation protein NfeD [Candidatus Acetothermia bacterium]